MRELRFRVWSESDKEYRTDCSIHKLFTSKTGTPATIYNDEGDCFLFEQYTGLKDKNGKEIYEGDIVANGTLTGIVEYKVDGFCAWTVGTITNGVVLLNGSWFVIGNIHKNPDLLGDE